MYLLYRKLAVWGSGGCDDGNRGSGGGNSGSSSYIKHD